MTELALNPAARPYRGMRYCTLLIFLTTLFVTATSSGQVMKKGVSVQLPTTTSAIPMPNADLQSATVIAVTAEGRVFCETSLTTPEDLTQEMKNRLADGSAEVYVKADARAQYAVVAEVLAAIRAHGVRETSVLTAQQELAPVTIPAAPKGLPVSLDSPLAGYELAVVQVTSGGRSPIVNVNNQVVTWNALQQKLSQLVTDKGEGVLLLKADGALPFASVAHVIDAGHSTGLKIFLILPALQGAFPK